MDPVALITTDHREVEQLFARARAGATTDTDAVATIVRELSMHAAAEEQVVYPALRRTGDDGDRLADQAIAEHQRAKELLVRLDRDAGDRAALDELVQAITQHVQEEERDLLPRLRAELDDDAYGALGDAFDKAKRMAPTHPHPHAPNTPPGNVVAGAAAAVVDRARDAISGDR